MNERDTWVSRLEELGRPIANALGDAQRVVGLNLAFRFYGATLPSEVDLEVFHRVQPIVRLAATTDESIGYIQTSVFRRAGSPAPSSQEELRFATEEALLFGRAFLLALSAASTRVFFWRGLQHELQGMTIEIEGDDRPRNLVFGNPQIDLPRAMPLDLAYLATALNCFLNVNFGILQQGFLSNYENGTMFLMAPSQFASFLPDAHLSFFRCLEYVVMDRIIGRTGQLEKAFLQKCFDVLGVLPPRFLSYENLVKHGVELIRRRGESSGHLLKKSDPSTLDRQEIYDLKSLVDFLFHVSAQRGYWRGSTEGSIKDAEGDGGT